VKKKFKLDEIDCANCAAKLETAIRKLPGVDAAAVSFLTQKMTLEAADDVFEDVLDRVDALIRKLEPDCRVVR